MSCTYGISIEKHENGITDPVNVAYKVRLSEYGSQVTWKFMDADGGQLSTSSFAQHENVNEVSRHVFLAPASLLEQTPSCQMGWLMNHVPAIFKIVRNLQSEDRIDFLDKGAIHRWTASEWKKKQAVAVAEAEILAQWDKLEQETPINTHPTTSHPRL